MFMNRYASSLSETNENLQAELSNLRREVVDMELHMKEQEAALDEESVVALPNMKSIGVMVDALTANISSQSELRDKLEAKLKDMDAELRMAYDSIEDLEDRVAALTEKKSKALALNNATNEDRSSTAIASILSQLYYFFLRPLQVGLELSSKTMKRRKRSYRDWMMGIYHHKYRQRYGRRRERNVTISDVIVPSTTTEDVVHSGDSTEECDSTSDEVLETEKVEVDVIQDNVSNDNLPADGDSKVVEDLSSQLSESLGTVTVLEAENRLLRDNLTALSAVLNSKTG